MSKREPQGAGGSGALLKQRGQCLGRTNEGRENERHRPRTVRGA